MGECYFLFMLHCCHGSLLCGRWAAWKERKQEFMPTRPSPLVCKLGPSVSRSPPSRNGTEYPTTKEKAANLTSCGWNSMRRKGGERGRSRATWLSMQGKFALRDNPQRMSMVIVDIKGPKGPEISYCRLHMKCSHVERGSGLGFFL